MKTLFINSLLRNYKAGDAIFDGRAYKIVPIIMLVEGVHSGSAGALYYPDSELAKYPQAWDGRPAPVNHPEINGVPVTANCPEILESRVIGQIFNAKYSDKKLSGELWIDIEKANAIDPKVMDNINDNKEIEISTGLYSDLTGKSGEWNGEPYDDTVINIRPDHVAILPDATGACSLVDGCGIRANEKKDILNKGGIMLRLFKLIGNWMKLDKIAAIRNDASLDDINDFLWRFVNSLDTDQLYHYLYDVYPDQKYFVYTANSKNPDSGTIPVSKLYKRSYAIDTSGKVTVLDDAIEVTEKTEYIPVTQPAVNTEQSITSNIEEKSMDKATMIKNLIECSCTRFTKADEVFLNTLSEDQLGKLGVSDEALAKINKADEKPADPPKVETKTEAPAANAEVKPQTVADYIKAAPAEIASVFNTMLKNEEMAKAAIIEKIKANKANPFTDDQLKAMGLAELQNLAKLASIEVNVDYGGQSGHVRTNDGTVPAMEPAFVPKV